MILTPLPWWGRAGLLLALALSLGYGFVTHARRLAPWAIRGAQQSPAGDWMLELVGGQEVAATKLLPTGFTGQGFAVLNFRTGRIGFRTLVLVRDAIGAEEMRRLRTGEGFRSDNPRGTRKTA